jgi:pimeloyl-ACP methyl ester carboxylesterase
MSHRALLSCVLGWSFLIAWTPARALQPAPPAVKDVILGECLVLGPVGRYGREALHRDALEADLVTGRWTAPKAGDKVSWPEGGMQTWEAAKARDGALNHPALRGGYAYWKVTTDVRRAALLEASGHIMVYVNGEPRIGDPYQNGIVRLPVELQPGANDFLFHCSRGRLTARLVSPPSPLSIDLRDPTTPDVLPGETAPLWAAVVVINASPRSVSNRALRATVAGTEPLRTALPPLPPWSTRKVGFRIPVPAALPGAALPVELQLQEDTVDKPQTRATAKLELRVRRSGQSYKRTFQSAIDGSVQYFAVQPAHPPASSSKPLALVLTLHGAAVEGLGQADAYRGKTWAHLVAPTNRRPYGFDWEEWGRLDALEVLEIARKQLNTDPLQTYLTGHSMGGHGVWHLGVTFPDQWAAIAPSAGWISFSTYPTGPRKEEASPVGQMLRRAASPRDTLTLVRNCAQHGVFILHGSADDNVPVDQARRMRQQLGGFHPDFVYHEQPGAGHWWGSACVDWPPLFEFLAARTRSRREDVRVVDFITASPGVSAWSHWAGIEAQFHALEPSSIHLQYDPKGRRFSGSTTNVARLALDLAHLKAGEPVQLELDGQKLENVPWPAPTPRLWLQRDGERWSLIKQPPAALKGPHRYGPFKEAFRNHLVFVYGTRGTAAENAWAFAKARFDAETFWYRGNGSVDVIPDSAFDPRKEPDRSVILYGHADQNTAWKALLGQSPVQVYRGGVDVGERKLAGEDLACLFLRPRPGSERACVGVVSGSGLVGLRLTDRLPYFVSGVAYPDCLILTPMVLSRGSEGVRLAGFFGANWSVASGEWVWNP